MFEGLFAIFLNNLNYFSIFILMTIESSFIPFPSEVVMIPAGYLVSTGKLNIYLVILFGILGSIAGAVVNYVIGKYLGREIILKHKKLLFINEKHLHTTEKYFKKNGSKTIFIGRLIPVIRQYISIPAGFANMHFGKFILFTSLGAGIWTAFLTILGYSIGQSAAQGVVHIINIVLVFIVVVFAGVFAFYRISKTKKH
jgi:membrane protein DedA with SNARE-associated domain